MKYIIIIISFLFIGNLQSQNTITEGVDWVEFNFDGGGTCRAFDCFDHTCFGDRCRITDNKGNKYMIMPQAWVSPVTGAAFADSGELDAFLVGQYARICQSAAPVQTEISSINDCDDVIDCLPEDIDTIVTAFTIIDNVATITNSAGQTFTANIVHPEDVDTVITGFTIVGDVATITTSGGETFTATIEHPDQNYFITTTLVNQNTAVVGNIQTTTYELIQQDNDGNDLPFPVFFTDVDTLYEDTYFISDIINDSIHVVLDKDGNEISRDTLPTYSFVSNDGSVGIEQTGNTFDFIVQQSTATNTDNDQGFGVQEIGDHTADGITTNFNETVVGFTNDPSDPTLQIFTAEDGTEYCVPKCITYQVNAVDGSTITDRCIFNINLADNGDTPCQVDGTQFGNSSYALVNGSGNYEDEGFVINIDDDGTAMVIITGNECDSLHLGVTFDYIITCPDGTSNDATWTINYTPPPIGEIRLNKSFTVETSESGDIVEIQLTVTNVGTGPITDIEVTDPIDIAIFQIPATGGLLQGQSVTGSVSLLGNVIVWDLQGTSLAPNASITQSVFLEQIDNFEYYPNAAKAEGNDGVNGPASTVDYGIDELSAPPSLTRISQLGDGSVAGFGAVADVLINAEGSLDCDNSIISDLTNYCVYHPIHYSDGLQDHDTPAVDTTTSKTNNLDNFRTPDITLSGATFELVEVKQCGNSLTFDWSNSDFGLAAADQTVIEGFITVSDPVKGEISYAKRDIDGILKGSNYADNCDYDATNAGARTLTIAGVATPTGVNYFNTVVGLQERFDVDGSPEMEGGFLVLEDARVEDPTGTGPCGSPRTSTEEEDLYVGKKAMKRVKHSFITYSTGNLTGTLPSSDYAISLNRPQSRNGFTTQCGVIENYTTNGPGINAGSSDYGSEWWRLDKANTDIDWGLTDPVYSIPVSGYGGDSPLMPTNADPNGPKFAYNEIISQRLNGLIAESSSIYEKDRVNGNVGLTRTTNPKAAWSVSGPSLNFDDQVLFYQFGFNTANQSYTYGNQADNYDLKLSDWLAYATTRSGNINVTEHLIDPDVTDSAGNITAAAAVFRQQPEFMDIDELFTFKGRGKAFDDSGEVDLTIYDLNHRVQIKLVETY